MFKKFLPLNLVLAALLIFVIMQFVKTVQTSQPNDITPPDSKKIFPHENYLSAANLRPFNHYSVIYRNDLFSPERKPQDESDSGEEEGFHTDAVANEDYKLHGTIIIGKEKVAFVEEIKTRSVERYYLGDDIGDYTIENIENDKVILTARGDSRETIKLFQETERKSAPRKGIRKPRRQSSSSRREPARPPTRGRSRR
jgi:NOL1/NOP2/fmu family ribosome biogenesis protein